MVLDLEPATWYNLRITAHNSAGFTVAEYDFATLTVTGGIYDLFSDSQLIPALLLYIEYSTLTASESDAEKTAPRASKKPINWAWMSGELVWRSGSRNTVHIQITRWEAPSYTMLYKAIIEFILSLPITKSYDIFLKNMSKLWFSCFSMWTNCTVYKIILFLFFVVQTKLVDIVVLVRLCLIVLKIVTSLCF